MKNLILGSVSGAALSFAIIGVATFAPQARTQESKADHHTIMQACSKSCSDCQRACDTCATHCTRMLQQGKKEHATTLATCQDCATTCSAAAQISARSGPFSKAICTACAEACSSCAKECEKFPDDKMMKLCAQECNQCEKACREMLKDAESAK